MTRPGEFIHMDPAMVGDAMRVLSETGRHLGTDWQACKSLIAGNEAGIGPDPLGQAFRLTYDAASVRLRDQADQMAASIMNDADAGMRCVDHYCDADATSAAGFAALTPGGETNSSPDAHGDPRAL